jgi:HupE/UreJ protein
MSDFLLYAETGLNHGLSIRSFFLIMFFMALAIPFSVKDWKKMLAYCLVFSLGYVLALLLSAFGIVVIKAKLITILVPVTILIVALYNLLTAGKTPKKDPGNLVGFILFFFGVIHGLGFTGYFESLFFGKESNTIVLLLEFSVGIIAALIIIMLLFLILSYIIHTFFRFSKRDFVLVLSAFVIGVVVPVIFGNVLWE